MEQDQKTEYTVAELADRLLEQLARAIGELDQNCITRKVKIKEGNTETTTEYREATSGGTVDRGGLKQLTAALKELQIIKGELTELEQREREARIQSLHRGAGLPEVEDGDTGIILLPRRMEEQEVNHDQCDLEAPEQADAVSGAEGI